MVEQSGDIRQYIRIGGKAGVQAGCLTSTIFSLLILGVITYATYQPDMTDGTPILWLLGSSSVFLLGIIPGTVIGFIAGVLTGICFYWLCRFVVTVRFACVIAPLFGVIAASLLLGLWVTFLNHGFGELAFEEFAGNLTWQVLAIPLCIPAGIYTGWKFRYQ